MPAHPPLSGSGVRTAWWLPDNPLTRLSLFVVLVSGVVCVVLISVQVRGDVGVGTGSTASVLVPLATALAAEVFVIVGLLGWFQTVAGRAAAAKREETARAAAAKRAEIWEEKLADEFEQIGEETVRHAFRVLADLVVAARNFSSASHSWGDIQSGFADWNGLTGLQVETIDSLVAAAMEIRLAVRDEPGRTQRAQFERFRMLQQSTWFEAELVQEFSAVLGTAVSAHLAAVPDVSEDVVRGHARLSTAQAALRASLARTRLIEHRLRDSEGSKPTVHQTDLAALHLDPLDLPGAARKAVVELATAIAVVMEALLHLRKSASGEPSPRSLGGEDKRVRELLKAGYAGVRFENSRHPYLDELLTKKAADRGSLR